MMNPVHHSSFIILHSPLTASRSTYLGLFTVALSTLMYEILLTRIFSVTMWYHFAFVAVSIALFGMTLGAVLVYIFPRLFTHDRTHRHLALASFLFGLSTIASFLLHLRIPFNPDISASNLLPLLATYALISAPFVFSGVAVCLALTRFPAQVSRLYSADLAGAALGCLLLAFTLNYADAPSAVFIVASLATLSAVAFAAAARSKSLALLASLTALILLAIGLSNAVAAVHNRQWIRLEFVKGGRETRPLYEQWNSFSRIRVEGDPARLEKPAGWGLSSTYPADKLIHQLYMNIDATAGTYLTRFDGDFNSVDFLRYDITNLVHYIRPRADVLAIGAGGGRDVLSALAFDQRSVTGVEINGAIIHAVNDVFGDFTGHLDRRPNVRFVNDEARSFIARSTMDFYDVIQISLIDTWAATAAGAFVLSENSLYTVESWDIFLHHLRPGGILTVSRWYHAGIPAETYRVASLANAALRRRGLADPRQHLVIVTSSQPREPGAVALPDGIATILVSRDPFTPADLDRIDALSRTHAFSVLLSPRTSTDPNLTSLASSPDLDKVLATFPINLAPPTDDQPFFFNMARFRDAFNPALYAQAGHAFNTKAITVLGGLLLFVIILTLLFILLPVALRSELPLLVRESRLSLYFASIGLGFMLVEISQLQRLTVLLGHPTYSLSVVLVTLLVSSGLGSFSTQSAGVKSLSRSIAIRLTSLLIVLAAIALLTPPLIARFQSASTPLRIALAVAILFPAGFFMGMAFPLGMKLAATRRADITPWLWAINGATSVCASVLAVVIAMAWGITPALWTGLAFYSLALLSAATLKPHPSSALQITSNQ